MTVASTSHFAQIVEERVELVRLDDRAHALLRLAHQDLLGAQRRVAQRHPVEPHVHAAVAGDASSRGRAGQPGAAEVLDADDEVGGEHLEAALDEHLLHERVADLHGRPLASASRRRTSRSPAPRRRRCRRRRCAAPNSTTRLPAPDACASLMSSCAHHADAQRVDQRVARRTTGRRRPRRRCSAGRGSCRSRRCRRRRRAAPAGCPSASAGPNRSGSITATGRAPIDRMSRTMPPTPVAAPW